MSVNFPEEIILQILHNLPIKSIVRGTCVCKSWHSLIRNPSFISTHLTRTNNHLLLLRLRLLTSEHYILHGDNQQLAPHVLLDFPFKKSSPYFRVISSCNGIICLVLYKISKPMVTFTLWNPLIKKSLKLPKPSITFSTDVPFKTFIGFGFDSQTNDYKVLRIVQLHRYKEQEVELYSLNTNSWKNMTCVAPKYMLHAPDPEYKERDMHAFVNGVVHWVAFKKIVDEGLRNVVLGFDMSDEVFLEIKLPESLADLIPVELSIMKYGDSSIAVIKESVFIRKCDIWVMKEYGVVGSWTKLLSLEKLGRELPMVLGFRKSGDVLLQTNCRQIVSLDPRNLGVKDLGVREQAEYSLVDDYVESLVLLDNANAASYTINPYLLPVWVSFDVNKRVRYK